MTIPPSLPFAYKHTQRTCLYVMHIYPVHYFVYNTLLTMYIHFVWFTKFCLHLFVCVSVLLRKMDHSEMTWQYSTGTAPFKIILLKQLLELLSMFKGQAGIDQIHFISQGKTEPCSFEPVKQENSLNVASCV